MDQSTEPINSSEEQLQQLPWPYAEYHLRGHQTEANSNNQHPSQQVRPPQETLSPLPSFDEAYNRHNEALVKILLSRNYRLPTYRGHERDRAFDDYDDHGLFIYFDD